MQDMQDNAVQVTGAEVAGLFVADSDESLTTEERLILAALLTRDDRVDLAIPDKMDPRELRRTLDICSRVFLRVRHASGQLKLLIGRALLVIQNTPEVYTSQGFTSFDEFMSDGDRGLPHQTGISRAELYKAKSVAASVGPNMNLQDAREIGFSKMQLVAGYTEAGSTAQRELMQVAKTATMPQLRERMARSNMGVDEGDLQYDVLQITVTKNQKVIVGRFLANPQVRAYCESESAGTILERMVQEVAEEWRIQAMTLGGVAE